MEFDDPIATPARLLRGMSLDDGGPGITLFASPISTNKSLKNNSLRGIASNDSSEDRSKAKTTAPRRLSINKFGLREPASDIKFSIPAKMSFGDLSSNNLPSDNLKFSIPDSRELSTCDNNLPEPDSLNFEDMSSNKPRNLSFGELGSKKPSNLGFRNLGSNEPRNLSFGDLESNKPGSLSFGDLESNQPGNSSLPDLESNRPGGLSFGDLDAPGNEETSSVPGALGFGAMGFSANELPGTEENSHVPGALGFGAMGLSSLDFGDEPLTERANFEEDGPHDDRCSVGSANSAGTQGSNSRHHPLQISLGDFPSDTSNDDMPTNDRQMKFHIRRTSSMGFHHRSPKHYQIPNASNRIQDIERYYEIVKELGKGAFATVYEAISKKHKDKPHCALKILEKNSSCAERIQAEMKALRMAWHPNVTGLIDSRENKHFLFLIMELCEGGELFDAIVERGNYVERDAALVVRNTLRALAHLHSKGIVHGDIKPENLLLAQKGNLTDIKLTDFGMAMILSENCQLTFSQGGTLQYVAPECIISEENGVKSDVWSVGIITVCLLSGEVPFSCESTSEYMRGIAEIQESGGDSLFTNPFWDQIGFRAKDFLKQVLQVDPEQRADATEALQHDWFKWAEAPEPKKAMPIKRARTLSHIMSRSHTKSMRDLVAENKAQRLKSGRQLRQGSAMAGKRLFNHSVTLKPSAPSGPMRKPRNSTGGMGAKPEGVARRSSFHVIHRTSGLDLSTLESMDINRFSSSRGSLNGSLGSNLSKVGSNSSIFSLNGDVAVSHWKKSLSKEDVSNLQRLDLNSDIFTSDIFSSKSFPRAVFHPRDKSARRRSSGSSPARARRKIGLDESDESLLGASSFNIHARARSTSLDNGSIKKPDVDSHREINSIRTLLWKLQRDGKGRLGYLKAKQEIIKRFGKEVFEKRKSEIQGILKLLSEDQARMDRHTRKWKNGENSTPAHGRSFSNPSTFDSVKQQSRSRSRGSSLPSSVTSSDMMLSPVHEEEDDEDDYNDFDSIDFREVKRADNKRVVQLRNQATSGVRVGAPSLTPRGTHGKSAKILHKPSFTKSMSLGLSRQKSFANKKDHFYSPNRKLHNGDVVEVIVTDDNEEGKFCYVRRVLKRHENPMYGRIRRRSSQQQKRSYVDLPTEEEEKDMITGWIAARHLKPHTGVGVSEAVKVLIQSFRNSPPAVMTAPIDDLVILVGKARHPLREHQKKAVQQLRDGKENALLRLNKLSGQLWYYPADFSGENEIIALSGRTPRPKR